MFLVARQNLSGKNQIRSRGLGSVGLPEFDVITLLPQCGICRNHGEFGKVSALVDRLLNINYELRRSACKPPMARIWPLHPLLGAAITFPFANCKKVKDTSFPFARKRRPVHKLGG